MKDESKSGKPKILVGHADDENDLPEGVQLHKARDPDAPARVQRMPKVIDDPSEMRRTKELFEKAVAKLYDQAMARIAEGDWVFSEHKFALKQQPEKSVADLHEMLPNSGLPAKARTKAAEILIALEDPAGEDFLFDALKSELPELRRAALESLRQWDVKVDVSLKRWSERILSLLNDQDERIVQAAAKLSAYHSISGTEERLIELLENGDLKDPAPIARELARVASTRRAVDALLPNVLKADDDEFKQWTGYTFRKLIEHPNPEIAGPVRKALYEYTHRFKKQRYDQILVDHLAKCADHGAIPVLEDISANASDPVSRTYAVEALARLQPDKAVDLLLGHIERVGARSDIVRTLRTHARENDFERISDVLVTWSKTSEKPFDTQTVRLFLENLGEDGKAFVEKHIEKLSEDARMWATWKLKGRNLTKALDELYTAGVIDTEPGKLIAKMGQEKNVWGEVKRVDTSDPGSLIDALATEGIVVMFDAETGMIPCDHDRLILQFANFSNDQFSPRWPVQFWHQERDEDYNAPYTIQFVLDDRLFRIGAENYGDWYDVDAVISLINFALKETGKAERFITLESGGQIAAFVFADPATFVPIARKYRLPLSDDASQAMRKGIEFEQRVINREN